MVEGARYTQLAKSVAANQQHTETHEETLRQHTELLEAIREQIASLTSSVATISNNMVVNSHTFNHHTFEKGSCSKENQGGKDSEANTEKNGENNGHSRDAELQ
jgi:hypothetical protein